MELKLDLSREYGVVLEGGGAKGAYQIGVWRALKEAGVRIKGIAGTSVGALNGALMCMDELEKAEEIWSNITYSKVMDIDDNIIEHIQNRDFKKIDLKQLAGKTIEIVKGRGLDISPLKQWMKEAVDEDKIHNSTRELFVNTFSVDKMKELVIDVRQTPADEVTDVLLASAYFPAFKNEKLGGKRFVDGGSINNVPISILVDRGYEDIIVIRIFGVGLDTERLTMIPEETNIYRIAPRQNLGGTLEFAPRRTKRNMTLGYYDGLRFLYGLEGRHYYFDAPEPESYYFQKMMEQLDEIRAYVGEDLDEQERKELEGYRAFTERIFPELAIKLDLELNWTYKDLYLAILEEWAKSKKLNRFCVYRLEEIIEKVMDLKK